jgi:hypothetical protein
VELVIWNDQNTPAARGSCFVTHNVSRKTVPTLMPLRMSGMRARQAVHSCFEPSDVSGALSPQRSQAGELLALSVDTGPIIPARLHGASDAVGQLPADQTVSRHGRVSIRSFEVERSGACALLEHVRPMNWLRVSKLLVSSALLVAACGSSPDGAEDPATRDAASAPPDASFEDASEPAVELHDAGADAAVDAGPPPDSLFGRAYEVLLDRCVFCHTNGGIGITVGKLDLSNPRRAYDALVGHIAEGHDCRSSEATRVIAGDAENSLLVQKLEHRQSCGVPMPDKYAPLASEEIATIRAWIDAGAPLDWDLAEEAAPRDPGAPPAILSATGLYEDLALRTLAQGVQPFTPRWPLWSDGATKERWVFLPPGKKIDTSDMDYWVYPVGTKVWKQFSHAGKPVETRLLHKVAAGQWRMMAYMWRLDGSDADAVPDGVSGANGTPHHIPDRETCKGCHDNMSDKLLGFSALQLSNEASPVNLTSLAAEGRLSHPPGSSLRVPGSVRAEQALGVLHANCGHCHNPASSVYRAMLRRPIGTGGPDLWERSTNLATLETTVGYASTVCRENVILPELSMIEPGDPARSEIVLRMRERGLGSLQMPPLGTFTVDTEGLGAVEAWIHELPPREL